MAGCHLLVCVCIFHFSLPFFTERQKRKASERSLLSNEEKTNRRGGLQYEWGVIIYLIC